MNSLPDWGRAHGPPLFAARIRSSVSDFVVNEQLDIDCSGDGEHDWLWLEKSGANTNWVAERLAGHAGVAPKDVGFAGLKDRHAVTRQWFSVRRPSGAAADWDALDLDGVRLLEIRRHRRKLKRGAHRGNSFRIVLRGDGIAGPAGSIAKRLDNIAAMGVPNYFGEQRFGRDGSNISLGQAVLAGRKVTRAKRGFGISALRSLEFNDGLSRRVGDGTWNRLTPGDWANLDGTGSVFEVETVTPELRDRCDALDIHPAGMLPGFESLRVTPAWRALRTRVSDLNWIAEDEALRLEFSLPKGSFATAVLREIASYESSSG